MGASIEGAEMSPIYQFMCDQCDQGTAFHRPITTTEKIEAKCEKCNEPMRRIFSAPALSFKGTGWGKGD